MCGIAGIINFQNTTLHLPTEVKKMSRAISHRGPDGEGFLFINLKGDYFPCFSEQTPQAIVNSGIIQKPVKSVDGFDENISIALAHRRLSIIDLSENGHQPFCSSDKKMWITYNGEIYNYIELRKELEKLGHTFRTNTDTEVLIQSYIQWGVNCVNKFDGMWAFALVDLNTNELFASRDRSGVKPFYYFNKNGLFAFASEQKALLKTSFIPFEVNEIAFFDFYVKGNLEFEEEGLFKNIFELFSSHSLKINLKTGELKKWKYFSKPNINSSIESFSAKIFTEKKDELETLLVDSISKRLRSDVTVGACLSGGIDSSLIVGIISDLLKNENEFNISNKFKTFTASFPGFNLDETKWAEQVAKANNSEWFTVTPNAEDFIKDFEESIYAQDIPIQSASTYSQLRVMKAAKNAGVKVVLDGQGSDELFAGYQTYQITYWNDLFKKHKYGKLIHEYSSFKGFPSNFSYLLREYPRFYGLSKLSNNSLKNFYEKYFTDIKFMNKDVWEKYAHRLEKFHEPIPDLNNHLFNEFYNTRLKNYLKCEDRSSMWNSVESRTPFADSLKLIEFSYNLSASYKIHKGINKYILREAAKKYVPQTILDRKDKKGFTTPTNEWIEKGSNYFMDLIKNSSNEFINTSAMEKSFFKVGDKEESMRVLKIPSFLAWQKVFRVKQD